MKCPFCKQEMTAGEISGNGHSQVHWQPEGVKINTSDSLYGKGRLKNVQYSMGKFKIHTNYCVYCKKMIFDTDILQ